MWNLSASEIVDFVSGVHLVKRPGSDLQLCLKHDEEPELCNSENNSKLCKNWEIVLIKKKLVIKFEIENTQRGLVNFRTHQSFKTLLGSVAVSLAMGTSSMQKRRPKEP